MLISRGLKKGREEEKKKLARNLLQRGTFSISEVASLCGVSEAYVRKAKKELKK
jgi:transposase